MEDISRELEKEIALAKPKPYKQNRKSRVFIVDDFGKMRSGEYLKKLSLGFGLLSIISLCSALVLYYLYADLSINTARVNDELSVARERVKSLTTDKEVLMARLVILGQAPDIKKQEAVTESETAKSETAKIEHKLTQTSKINPVHPPEPPKPQAHRPEAAQPPPEVKPPEPAQETDPEEIAPADPDPGQPEPVRPNISEEKKTVTIEKFSVTKEGRDEDLFVRFNIRNISNRPGDVSGRIFTVLKPDSRIGSQALVVPSAELENGVPVDYQKGQYFSISRFKPVKFKIKNHSDPNFFKKASIFIFNNDGELIFEELINITEAN